jgi:hypothetical protein
LGHAYGAKRPTQRQSRGGLRVAALAFSGKPPAARAAAAGKAAERLRAAARNNAWAKAGTCFATIISRRGNRVGSFSPNAAMA